MAKSTRQYVFEGMEVLPAALTPFVEKRLESALTGHWQVRVAEELRLHAGPNGNIAWDQAALLNAMDRFWSDAFKTVLGRAERSIVNELVAVRNKLSHNETFTYDDAERALDSMRRLMEAIGAGVPAERLGKMRDTILAHQVHRASAQRGAPQDPAAGGDFRRHGRRPVALARGRRTASGRRDRRVPAGGVRRRSRQGSRRQRAFGIRQSTGVLRTHLPHRRPRGASGRRGQETLRHGWRSGGRTSDQLRRRQNPLHAGAPITWQAERRRGTCPVSINCFRSTAQRYRNTSAARSWSARGAARRT